jgi:hypothetical protein
MTGKIPKSVGAILTVVAILALSAASAGASTIYNNLPKPKPGNVASVGFEATSTSEFGGQVEFAGTARNNPAVTVMMSSWGCQEGSWNTNSCHTVGGATFSQPLTLNVYAVEANNEPGAQVASVTQTFNIPFRPSASSKCTGAQVGEWSHAGECFNGKATNVTFNLTGVTLPSKAILSVAFNTSNYGAAPLGPKPCAAFNPSRCAYDALNVGTTEPANEASPEPVNPSVGSDPLPAYDYVNSKYAAMYEPEPHGTVGTFSLANGWTGYQPLLEVKASK